MRWLPLQMPRVNSNARSNTSWFHWFESSLDEVYSYALVEVEAVDEGGGD